MDNVKSLFIIKNQKESSMEIIENKTYPLERDLYHQHDLKLINCRFEGIEDGESALKECTNIELDGCFMDLRYPLWHNHHLIINNTEQTPNCRASLWYSNDIQISNSKFYGIKALRECKDIVIQHTEIDSPEFGWKSENIYIEDSTMNSQYIFFLVRNLKAKKSTFTGKYGFQYMENVEFDYCHFTTKDAFWHSKNVTVRNSTIEGEYLGWYSENLTFINCTIKGIQPLCYCKNLKLLNCEMIDANLAFEYSTVDAKIVGEIDSIKNPISGTIEADQIGEVILTKDSLYESHAKIVTNR